MARRPSPTRSAARKLALTGAALAVLWVPLRTVLPGDSASLLLISSLALLIVALSLY